MSSRSDVSKMLVSHRGASSVISSGGSSRAGRSARAASSTSSGKRAHTVTTTQGAVASPATTAARQHHAWASAKSGTAGTGDIKPTRDHHAPTSLSSSYGSPGRAMTVGGTPASNSAAAATTTVSTAPLAGGTAPFATGPGLTTSTSNNSSNKSSSYGFIQMKCLEILKRAGGPIHIQELQLALGRDYSIVTDKEFLVRLRANPRVHFDPITKQWSFTSPYQGLTSREAILNRLRSRPLEINQEVLDLNKNISVWINEILAQHMCRAVRGTRIARCKVFSAESGLFCNLYDPPNRCDPCQSLQGVFLYQLGSDAAESVEIDGDLKELWHKIPPTTPADIESLTEKKQPTAGGLTATNPSSGHDVADGKVKRRKPGGRPTRIHKIANVHMYSTEELREALSQGHTAEELPPPR